MGQNGQWWVFLWCTPAASRGFQLDMTKAGSIGVNHKLCCVLNWQSTIYGIYDSWSIIPWKFGSSFSEAMNEAMNSSFLLHIGWYWILKNLQKDMLQDMKVICHDASRILPFSLHVHPFLRLAIYQLTPDSFGLPTPSHGLLQLLNLPQMPCFLEPNRWHL